jgi:hypothetical protein
MSASPGSIVDHVYQSQKVYYVVHENGFLVLPDGKTILGVEFKNEINVLFMEDITRNNANAYRQIIKYGHLIFNLLYNPISKTLFVGDNNGCAAQYQQDVNGETWTLAKNYGNLMIGPIFSVSQIGDFVLFGGGGSFAIKAINTSTETLLSGTLRTAIGSIYSLQVCKLPENKVYLSVCGQNPHYKNDQTDIYDVTELAKTVEYQFQLQEKLEETLVSESPRETSVKDIVKDAPKSCECSFKKVTDSLFDKMVEYLRVFQSVICSKFEVKLKSLIGKDFILIRRLLQRKREYRERQTHGKTVSNN